MDDNDSRLTVKQLESQEKELGSEAEKSVGFPKARQCGDI